MRFRFEGLWRHADFRKLWAGQTISLFGTLVGGFALSFVAILVLDASPFQVALLRVAQIAPGLVAGLFAGVWVDRLQRRPILIAADLGRFLLLASIPLAALLGVLTMTQLYLVSLLTSLLTVCFDVAYRSYLPALVRRDELVEGNSKLQASSAVAEVAGFGLAGALVQALTAPVAVLVDALSFLASAVSIALIRTRERSPDAAVAGPAPEEQLGAWREIGEGLRLLAGHRVLRTLAGATFTFELFRGFIGATYMIFVTRQLLLAPVVLGPLFALGGISALGGALVADRVTRRWGFGPTMIGALLMSIVGMFFVASTTGPLVVMLLFLGAQQLIGDGADTVYNIDQVSFLQGFIPDRLQGRMNASMHVIENGATLLGLLLGGLLAERVGLRPTLYLGATCALLAPLWLLCSPVRRLKTQPPPLEPAMVASATA